MLPCGAEGGAGGAGWAGDADGAASVQVTQQKQAQDIAHLRGQVAALVAKEALNARQRTDHGEGAWTPQLHEVQVDADRAERTLQLQVQQKMLEALERLSEKSAERTRRGLIKVEPKVKWPHLGDTGPGGREVEKFYEDFEDLVGLANDGAGMNDLETWVTLKNCVSGSRLIIYENLVKHYRAKGEMNKEPKELYQELKARLLRFMETSTERQMKARQKYANVYKGKHLTAHQFEAMWESVLAEMEECGLKKNELESFLDYLHKAVSYTHLTLPTTPYV